MALRIKDSVDLKELEKFGFYKPKKGTYKSYIILTDEPKDSHSRSHLSICDDREIMLIQAAWDSRGKDKLYYLIKADLVECVEDDN